MRRSFVDLVRCPTCRTDASLDLDVVEEDPAEIRTGRLICRACSVERPVVDGIVDLMADPPDFVRREALGLERFAEFMRNEGWDRTRILNLPEEPSGYWWHQRLALEQILDTVEFPAGTRLLDVGSNTCWASAAFADRGLDVVALDISTVPMQGLRTADWWFAERGVFFERVVGTMFDIPLASESVDFVWCSQVLHHNDRGNLVRTLAEMSRVLRPGGRLLVVNETLRSVRKPLLHPGRDVAMWDGYEHAYTRRTYVRAARDAGLVVELLPPRFLSIFGGREFGISPEMTTLDGFRAAAGHAIRRSRTLTRAYLVWHDYVAGEGALFMIGTKPSATNAHGAIAAERNGPTRHAVARRRGGSGSLHR
jgi:SAM-dependent methyltransferase